MKRFLLALGLIGGLPFFSAFVYAPRSLMAPPFLMAQNPRTETPYLLPQTIFVGDQGRLVVPLGQAYAGAEPFTPEVPVTFPLTQDLEIKNIELERRGGLIRLLIDFVPFAPGILAFPPLEFPMGSGLPAITGLEVQVASVLTPAEMALSNPASALAVPGTSFLVYGSIALILVLLFLGIGGSVWGRLHFRDLWERFRRRHLLRVMLKFLIRLRRECCVDKDTNPGYYLSLLSSEFREFLSQFSGINCRSLTAGEFLELPAGYPVHSAETNTESSSSSSVLSPVFLCSLFRSWDVLRFSGRNVQMTDLFQALNETKKFIAALEIAERERPLQMKGAELRAEAGEGL